jgi:hypothetical protein
MKTKVVTALLSLFLSPAFCAELVETNITLSFKLHVQQDPVSKSGSTTKKYTLVTLKNADIIRMIGVKQAKTFTKSARLLVQTRYDSLGYDGYDYIIRDAGVDTIVTSYFQINNESDFQAEKSKFSDSTGLGSRTYLALGYLNVPLAGTFQNVTEGLDLTGPMKITTKRVKSIQFPGKSVNFDAGTLTLTGLGKLLDGKSGLISGTFKTSGAKILK